MLHAIPEQLHDAIVALPLLLLLPLTAVGYLVRTAAVPSAVRLSPTCFPAAAGSEHKMTIA